MTTGTPTVPDEVSIPGPPEVHARTAPSSRMIDAGHPGGDFCSWCGDDWPCHDVREHLARAAGVLKEDTKEGQA